MNKTLFAILLFLLLLVTGVSRADVIMGDANQDGEVTISDVVATTNHIHNDTPAVFRNEAADVNGDGIITIADIVGIINIIHYSSYESSGIVSLGTSINDWVEGNGGGEELTLSQEYGD